MSRTPLAAVVRHIHALAERASGTSPPDRHLLERFLHQRDESAFAVLARRHGAMVLSVARRILDDTHAAEDIFQNTFLTLARRAASIRKHEALPSWLYGVAARLASQARLQEARRKARERTAATPSCEDVTEAAAWRELGAVLDEELQKLPEKYRTPLVLIYFAGKTQEAAASQLGWSKGTLRRRLERGKQLLHARLVRRGVSLSVGLLTTAIAQSAAEAALPAVLIQNTVAEAVKVATTQATGWLIGLVSLTRAKLALVLGLLLATGRGLAVLPMMSRQQAEEKPEESAPPPAPAQKQPRVDRLGDPLPQGALARLGTMRFRHAAGMTFAFAPDGKTLLTCGGNRMLRTWDVASGRLLGEQRFASGLFPPMVVLSLTGRLLAFEDNPGSLVIWDVSHREIKQKLAIEEPWPHAVFSPDEKTLVTAEYGGAMRAWDVPKGRGRLLEGHKGNIFSLDFTAKGTLMSLGDDQTVRFWDLAAGRQLSRITVPKGIESATVSPDGKVVATWTYGEANTTRKLQFWDADSGVPRKNWIAPDSRPIRAVRFAPDGKTILISTNNGVLVWNPPLGKCVRTLAGESGFQLLFSRDGKMAASLGGRIPRIITMEPMLHVWDLSLGTRHAFNRPDRGHLGTVDGIAFTSDSRLVASFSNSDGGVYLWDASSGKPLHSFALQKQDRPFSTLHFKPMISFTRDDKHLLIGTRSFLTGWEVATGREIRRFPLFDRGEEHPLLLLMHLTDDGRTVFSLEEKWNGDKSSYQLYAWNTATGKRLVSMPLSVDGDSGSHYSPSVRFLGRFSPDGRLLAMPDGRVLDTETGKESAHLTVNGKGSLGAPIAFSPDGALMALGIEQVVRREGAGWKAAVAVQIWETATLLPVTRLETGELNHLMFTPDGRHLLTADVEMVKRWDLASGRLVARRRISGDVRDIAGGSLASAFRLAPDGRTVAIGQPDTTVLLWDLPSPTPEHPAVTLTAAQRAAYWRDLAGEDAGRAFTAIARLADAPAQTLTMLRDRLKPVKAPAAHELRRLIADLDHQQFKRREAATQRLRELAEVADAALREALRSKPSLEMRRRLEDLLAESRVVRTPKKRRQLRAVRVLESIGTVEARQMLELLAKGTEKARLTREANAALRRLARRP